MVEQLTFNQRVIGSSPVRSTIFTPQVSNENEHSPNIPTVPQQVGALFKSTKQMTDPTRRNFLLQLVGGLIATPLAVKAYTQEDLKNAENGHFLPDTQSKSYLPKYCNCEKSKLKSKGISSFHLQFNEFVNLHNCTKYILRCKQTNNQFEIPPNQLHTAYIQEKYHYQDRTNQISSLTFGVGNYLVENNFAEFFLSLPYHQDDYHNYFCNAADGKSLELVVTQQTQQ